MNLRYALNPLYISRLMKTRYFIRTHPELPWLTRDAVGLLSTMLHADDCGLEWGSGRSTVWLSRRTKHVISIEHDRKWFEHVQKMVAGRTNVDLRLCEVAPEDLPVVDGQDNHYVQAVDGIEPESLDYVLVDGGLSRVQCAHRAVGLLRAGGILILDNANWYLESSSRAPGSRHQRSGRRSDAASWDYFLVKVSRWRHIWTTDGVTCTALWIKP